MSGFVATITQFDQDGRSTDTWQATYLAGSGGALDFTVTPSAGSPGVVSVANAVYDDATQSAGGSALHTGHTDYDSLGRVADTIDQYVGQTTNTYDANGNLIRTVYPDGTEVRTVYDAMGRAIWTTDRFKPANGDTTSSANVALVTHTIYDSLGQVIGTERYDNLAITLVADTSVGNGILKAVAPTGLSSASANFISSTASFCDQQGRTIETIDAAGLRTGSIFNADGSVAYSGVLNSAAPDGGHATTASGVTTNAFTTADLSSYSQYLYNQWDATAQEFYNRVIDPNGHHTDTYEDASSPIQKTVYDDGSTTETIQGIGNQPVSGHVVAGQTITGHQTTTINQMGQATDSFYDLSGNLTDVYEPAVMDNDPNSPTFGQSVRPHWHYDYDASGNQISQSEPGVTSLDSNPRTTTFAFDENGNKVRQTLPDGEVQTWAFDANGNSILHKVYASGGTTATATTFDVYDTTAAHAGRLLGEYRYASDFTPTGTGIDYAESTSYDDKTIYTYDDSTTLPSAEQTDLGRVAQVDDYAPVGGTLADTITHTTYDPITGQQASISSPEGTIDYSYNPATGQLIETSTDGTDTHYGYDSQERLQTVHVTELDGASVDQTTTYAYDPAGNLASVAQPTGDTTVYSYNDLNQLTDEVATDSATDEPVFSDHYDLNADGTRHDVIETQYNGDGSVFAKTETNWSYDADGRLTGEQLVILNDGTGGTSNADGHAPTPYDDVFKFDLANNRVEEDTTGGTDGTGVITYTYNSDDQLLTETRTGSNPYAIVYGHTAAGVFSKGYDALGDQTETHRTGTNPEDDAYTWNLRGEMTSAAVTRGGSTVTTDDTYDSNGVRTSETTNAGTSSAATTFYLNDPNNPTGYTKAIEEKQGATAATATVSRSYVLGLKVEGQSDGTNGSVYFLTDGHGSTRALVNTSGVVIERYDYDAFGTMLLGQHIDPTTQAVTNVTAATAATPWLFGGDGLYDPSTGWTYQLARWRDGFRFTSSDSSAGDPSSPISLHKYVYANGNPVMYDDPSGHDGELAGLLTTIGGIAGLIASYAIPIVEAATPYLSALTLVTAFADPQAMEDFIATGGDPAALIGDLVNLPGLVADDARDLLVFGRGLLQDAKVLGVGGEEVRALQGAVNNVGGNLFQEDAQASLGLLKGNETVYPTSTPRGPVNVQPDLPVGKLYGVTDVKDVVNITATDQLRGFGALAKQSDPPLPFSLIISPRTQSISGSVLDQIRRSNGIVAQFDSSTNTWTQITLPGSGGWRR